MKEEIPNCKLSSLLKVVEKMGHPYITHFKYTAAGTERDMMMNVGEVVSGKTVEQVLKSQTYGILFDEVTDISVKQQMVCFIQYIDKTGHANVDFLDIANVLEFGTSSDAETLFKTLGLDIANCSSFVSDGASVMVGKENGVAAKMKQVIPTMVFILYLPS
jgi:YesN/AraC family two-component response regulator